MQWIINWRWTRKRSTRFIQSPGKWECVVTCESPHPLKTITVDVLNSGGYGSLGLKCTIFFHLTLEQGFWLLKGPQSEFKHISWRSIFLKIRDAFQHKISEISPVVRKNDCRLGLCVLWSIRRRACVYRVSVTRWRCWRQPRFTCFLCSVQIKVCRSVVIVMQQVHANLVEFLRLTRHFYGLRE